MCEESKYINIKFASHGFLNSSDEEIIFETYKAINDFIGSREKAISKKFDIAKLIISIILLFSFPFNIILHLYLKIHPLVKKYIYTFPSQS